MKKFSNNYNEHHTEAVTNWILRDVMPVYTIDNLGFHMMIKALAFSVFLRFRQLGIS